MTDALRFFFVIYVVIMNSLLLLKIICMLANFLDFNRDLTIKKHFFVSCLL